MMTLPRMTDEPCWLSRLISELIVRVGVDVVVELQGTQHVVRVVQAHRDKLGIVGPRVVAFRGHPGGHVVGGGASAVGSRREGLQEHELGELVREGSLST